MLPSAGVALQTSRATHQHFGTFAQYSGSSPSSFKEAAHRVKYYSAKGQQGLLLTHMQCTFMIISHTAPGFPTAQLLTFHFHLRN